MQVSCGQCNAKYKIGEEKLKGRERVRLKCKKCGHIIDVKVEKPSFQDEDTNSLFSLASNERVASSFGAKKEVGDVFEDNLFSGNKDEFNFEDVKATLVLNREEPTATQAEATPQGNPKFKSNFQMDFSDQTSQQNMLALDEQEAAPKRNSAAVSFETTQQISLEKFNEYQNQQAQKQSMQEVASPTLSMPQNQTSRTATNLTSPTANKQKQAKNDDPYFELSKEISKPSALVGFLKFFMLILLILGGISAFVLFKNNWQFDANNVPNMVRTAFGMRVEKKIDKTPKEKPLEQQFSIDSTKVKTQLIKLSRKRRDQRRALMISGEIKNIDTKKKSLTTIQVGVENIIEKKTLFEKRVYAGNVFTKQEVIRAKTEATLDAEYLQSGKNGSNWGVLPGKTMPFMVVFYLKKKVNLKEIKIKLDIKSTQ